MITTKRFLRVFWLVGFNSPLSILVIIMTSKSRFWQTGIFWENWNVYVSVSTIICVGGGLSKHFNPWVISSTRILVQLCRSTPINIYSPFLFKDHHEDALWVGIFITVTKKLPCLLFDEDIRIPICKALKHFCYMKVYY